MAEVQIKRTATGDGRQPRGYRATHNEGGSGETSTYMDWRTCVTRAATKDRNRGPPEPNSAAYTHAAAASKKNYDILCHYILYYWFPLQPFFVHKFLYYSDKYGISHRVMALTYSSPWYTSLIRSLPSKPHALNTPHLILVARVQ
jgi:hypothetical protein